MTMNKRRILANILRHARNVEIGDGLQHIRALNLLRYAIGCNESLNGLRVLVDQLRTQTSDAPRFIATLETAVVEAAEEESTVDHSEEVIA